MFIWLSFPLKSRSSETHKGTSELGSIYITELFGVYPTEMFRVIEFFLIQPHRSWQLTNFIVHWEFVIKITKYDVNDFDSFWMKF